MITPEQYVEIQDLVGQEYTTTVPTGAPNTETKLKVVKTGGLYYIYAWADGAWRRVQIS
jgi:hypothetical protein